MSYILDALKKAAEQRDAQAPAMRRLFSPVPEFAESPRWRLAAVGGAAAVAGAVVAIWALWPAPSVVIDTPVGSPATARVQPVAAPAAAHVQPEAPPATVRVQPEAPPAHVAPEPTRAVAPPIVRTAPKTAAPAKPAAERRSTPPPAVETRQSAIESAAAPAVEPRPAPIEPAPAQPQPKAAPPLIAGVRPSPIPTAATAPAAAPARTEASGQLRLEVIVYSEERARRLAFINGRKYVEGDQLLDGARIQEIQPNAVVIVDDGRRVVLKP